MLHLRRRSIFNARLSLFLATQYRKFNKRILLYKKVTWRQQAIIRNMSRRQQEQEASIAELKKRIDECDIKYSELTHTNQAVGGKTMAANTASDMPTAAPQPLRHFSSQIKLDLSVLPIGSSKRNSNLLPNMKPRKPLIKMPSLSEDDVEPPSKLQKTEDTRLNPSPSTSGRESPKTKSQATIAKIRGITNEIRRLSNLSKNFENKLKRPFNLSALDLSLPEFKKRKTD